MELFMQWLLGNSLKAGVLVLLVLVVQSVLGRRISARWKCFLWALVALRLVMPNSLPASFSVFNLWHRSAMAQTVERTFSVSQTGQAQSMPSVAAFTAKRSSPSLWAAVFMAWCSGAAALLAIVLFKTWKIGLKISGRRPLTCQRTLDLLEDCKAVMDVRAPVSVVVSPLVDSPALFGFVRPRLLLPESTLETLSPESLRYIFLHELAHLKRGDIAVNWLLTAAQAMHWFNPLVWLALARMRDEREMACDEMALAAIGGDERLGYGNAVIELLACSPNQGPVASMAGILENKKQMERRISMIRAFKRGTLSGAAVAVSAICVLGLLSLTEAKGGVKAGVASSEKNFGAACDAKAGVSTTGKNAGDEAAMTRLKEIKVDSLELEDAPLGTVVAKLNEKVKAGGKNISIEIDPAYKDEPQITMTIEEVPLSEAIRFICMTSGLDWWIDGDKVIMGKKR